ncbi:hypothetical protein [Mucilaginibacter sp. PAMB04168]|uniref:hypothetical protein n=1 Tax=Mucilaginibacter sp. PAMB04168 TaxID=3138567 RepID=UPI0031F708CD
MKVRYFIVALLICISGIIQIALADIPEPKVLRKQLLVALDRRSLTDSLYNSLAATTNKSPILTCYFGVVQALKAKHAWNPYFKVKHLNDSEKTLQQAVSREPDNMEIRFMRFSIEHNVPGFLGYGKHLTDDRNEMIKQLERKYYATADHEVVVTIIKFLLDSKRCTAEQNQILHKQLAALK